MRILALTILFSTWSMLTHGQFKNIVLDQGDTTQGIQPCEPSIAINQKRPNNIVAASVLNNIYVSQDTGKTWVKSPLASPFGVAGDPVLISDKSGKIYNFHLSNPGGGGRDEDWLDRIVCQWTDDEGKTWDEGSFAGLNPPKDQDKPWVGLHPKKGDLYLTWTQFDKYGSKDEKDQSHIMLSMSDNGKKWSDPIQVNQVPGDCLDGDKTVEGAMAAVTEEGKVFVAWAYDNKIFLDRSFDKGKMWLTNDIKIADQPGGWTMDIPGLSRCNGLPIFLTDNSKSIYRNSLYLAFADQRNGENDTDIWFIRSTNYGDNWTSPTRVNDDGPGKHQFLPWMTVDHASGVIYIVYYDRRAYDDNQTDVYLAYSIDGGSTFKNVKISETPFVPTSDRFFGDYTNISAHQGIIAPIWTRMDNGRTQVMTTIIRQSDLIKAPVKK